MQQTETRVTDWTECKGGPWHPDMSHGGFVAYRIWQQFDGLRWFQRHEWKRADGHIEVDPWINGAKSWCDDAKPIEFPAAA